MSLTQFPISKLLCESALDVSKIISYRWFTSASACFFMWRTTYHTNLHTFSFTKLEDFLNQAVGSAAISHDMRSMNNWNEIINNYVRLLVPLTNIAVQVVIANERNVGNTLKMVAVEDESFIPAAKLATDERLEWVPLSLTLVEYPQGNCAKEYVYVD